ncbi:hypothetical protein HQ560_21830, partial [bacterium]|nr:hypothetical protein [bacterium]
MKTRRTFAVLIALTLLTTCSAALANGVSPVLTTIAITPGKVTLNVGQSQQFAATGYDQYGKEVPITPTWTASGGAVDPNGLYTAPGAPGNFNVTAADLGVDGAIAVPVFDPSQSIIVDNRDRNTRRRATWLRSGGRNPWARDSRYATSRRARFWWDPVLPADGYYEVSAWWTTTQGRSKRVPYRVHHADGVAERVVNQRENGGRWVSFGTYRFAAGSPAFVVVSGEAGPVCADAVRFRPTGPVPPTVSIPDVLTARVGKPFTHVIQTTGSPLVSVSVTGLPGWLAFDGGDTLNGTSLAEGSWTIQVTATNPGGSDVRDVRVDSRNPCIIVDNRDRNTRRQATWLRSRGRNPWARDSRYATSRRAQFWWDPALPEDGYYEVSAWWTAAQGRSKRVPYRVHHADGIAKVVVNQR